MSLWGISVGCCSGVSLLDVSVGCLCRMSQWGVSMGCLSGVCLWDVSAGCVCGTFQCSVSLRRLSGVSLLDVSVGYLWQRGGGGGEKICLYLCEGAAVWVGGVGGWRGDL